MSEPTLPGGLIEGWRTPVFDFESVPDLLGESHLTTVWAELCGQSGSVRFVDLDGASRRDVRVETGDTAVIVPGVGHQIEPSSDATFFVRFYRESGADLLPGLTVVEAVSARGSGPWEHRGRDLDTPEEIFEMVTRQYADVVQDDLLQPYFNFGPGFIDWQAHIGSVTDYWCHVLLFAPGYEIDVIEAHRHLHDQPAFTPELFDRWLEIFHDTVDGGWTGPLATTAQKRSIGTAWAMGHRFLGPGVWLHPDHRS